MNLNNRFEVIEEIKSKRKYINSKQDICFRKRTQYGRNYSYITICGGLALGFLCDVKSVSISFLNSGFLISKKKSDFSYKIQNNNKRIRIDSGRFHHCIESLGWLYNEGIIPLDTEIVNINGEECLYLTKKINQTQAHA